MDGIWFIRGKLNEKLDSIKRKSAVWFMVMGILTGMMGCFIYRNQNQILLPIKKAQQEKDRERDRFYYKDMEKMKKFFFSNRQEFNNLETYFAEKRDWNFIYEQYEPFEGANGIECNYRRGVDFPCKYYGDWEYRNISEVSAELAGFLEFSTKNREVGGIVLYGDQNQISPYPGLKHFLEVRCYMGEEMISFLLVMEKPVEDGWEQLEELESGWYFSIYPYEPIKVKQ